MGAHRTMAMFFAVVNGEANSGCGVDGVGYSSQKWQRFSGTGGPCGCEGACCSSGLAGVSGWTYSSTCYCQQDSSPSQHTDVGSDSAACVASGGVWQPNCVKTK